jgi:glycosyltransferase involved in cell wall biosynthesis
MRTWDLFDTLAAGRVIGPPAGEQEHHFKLAENVARVEKGDLVVSDYYDPKKAMGVLRKVCGLQNELLVTASGKRIGAVWHNLQGQVEAHVGDDEISDVQVPRQFDIPAERTNLAAPTDVEGFLFRSGFSGLAACCREARLTSYDKEFRGYELLQAQVNFPFLFLCGILLHAKLDGVTSVLMSSRDCCLWFSLMRKVCKLLGGKYHLHYYLSSRLSRLKASPEHLAYTNSLLGGPLRPSPAVVDFVWYGGTLAKLLAKTSAPNVPIFVLGKYTSANTRSEALLPETRMLSHIEGANRARHAMVADTDEKGHPTYYNPSGFQWEKSKEIQAGHETFRLAEEAMSNYDFSKDIAQPLEHIRATAFTLAERFEQFGTEIDYLDRRLMNIEEGAIKAAVNALDPKYYDTPWSPMWGGSAPVPEPPPLHTLQVKDGVRVSIFTPTHNPVWLREAYNSIKNQPFYEWVIVYNSGSPRIGFDKDPRVKEFDLLDKGRGFTEPFKIGFLKNDACLRCTGDVMLELDHDDMLLPGAIEEVQRAFEDDPAVGFVYSNDVLFTPTFERPTRFNPACGWQWREYDYNGHSLDEVVQWEPHPANVGRIWFAPDHLRSWRSDLYRSIGGHDKNRGWLDDLDLMCRLYPLTTFKHIDKPLYMYRIHGGNTWLRPEINKAIQEDVWPTWDMYIQGMAEVWAKRKGLKLLELGGRMAAKLGYITVDLKDADVITDLNKPWPWEDSTVGVVRAYDVFEHLTDSLHTFKELYRVLSPGGMAFIQVPSTDGRGAWADPTHKTFYNVNSFYYFMDRNFAKYIDTPVRFYMPRLFTTTKDGSGTCWVRADAISLKNGFRPGGEITI